VTLTQKRDQEETRRPALADDDLLDVREELLDGDRSPLPGS
jgi:hypothetical protein